MFGDLVLNLGWGYTFFIKHWKDAPLVAYSKLSWPDAK